MLPDGVFIGSGRLADRLERLDEIGNDVVDPFDADGDSDACEKRVDRGMRVSETREKASRKGPGTS